MNITLKDLTKRTPNKKFTSTPSDEKRQTLKSEDGEVIVLYKTENSLMLLKDNSSYKLTLNLILNKVTSMSIFHKEYAQTTTWSIKTKKLEYAYPRKVELAYDVVDSNNILESCHLVLEGENV